MNCGEVGPWEMLSTDVLGDGLEAIAPENASRLTGESKFWTVFYEACQVDLQSKPISCWRHITRIDWILLHAHIITLLLSVESQAEELVTNEIV